MINEPQRKAVAKYQASPKGKAALKRAQELYNHSRKGRAARRRYLQSSKGQAAVRDCKRRTQIMR